MGQKKVFNEVICVDIGGTNLRVARVKRDGTVTTKQTTNTPKFGNDSFVITREITRLIHTIQPEGNIAAISISSAGPLDLAQGCIDHCPNIPLGVVPLVAPLEEAFHCPVFLFKDTHAGVLGEKFFGSGHDVANLVYITISTGIGGGVIANNHLIIGRNGNAGEIGRFFVFDEPYFWNSCASGTFLLSTFKNFCKRQSIECTHRHARDIFAAAREGNLHAVVFMEELGRINGRGLSDAIVAYDPERIIFGGSVFVHNQDLLLPPLLRHTDDYLPLPDIQITKLGDDVSLLGAAAGVFFKEKY